MKEYINQNNGKNSNSSTNLAANEELPNDPLLPEELFVALQKNPRFEVIKVKRKTTQCPKQKECCM